MIVTTPCRGLSLSRFMTRRFLLIAVILPFCTASAETPASSAAVKASHGKALATYAPAPDYPIQARERHFTGSGVVLLQVDPKTGYVIGAQILKSAGDVILDNAALSAFTRWRFKPGTVRQVRLPIHYTMN